MRGGKTNLQGGISDRKKKRTRTNLGESETLLAERALGALGRFRSAHCSSQLHQRLIPSARLVRSSRADLVAGSRVRLRGHEKVGQSPDKGGGRFGCCRSVKGKETREDARDVAIDEGRPRGESDGRDCSG